jgi:hypothetical protein
MSGSRLAQEFSILQRILRDISQVAQSERNCKHIWHESCLVCLKSQDLCVPFSQKDREVKVSNKVNSAHLAYLKERLRAKNR